MSQKAKLQDYVTFKNPKDAKKWANKKIPMATLYEMYITGDLDIPGDIYDFMAVRDDITSFTLTPAHMKWFVTNFLPEVLIHSKSQDKRIVREHYDRGNDFFEWFLGERMVYTSGYFHDASETLEEAQDHKMDLVCQKLKLQPGDRLLDIGCGWGTLVRHAAKYYGVDATGVTIAEKQTEFANKRIKDWGLEDKCRVLCKDYRDIPKQKFNKIVSLEMVEHVGVKNLQGFYDQVYNLLEEDGLFLLQWTGLRRGFKGEDLIWGLFMNKYIFPGADASLCPSGMLKYMEKSNWEPMHMETITMHYVYTIERWAENWVSNKDKVIATYGDWWYRLWHFFLVWSTMIGRNGSATCQQVLLNKNINAFNRSIWVPSAKDSEAQAA